MLQFLDPEIARILQFLGTETAVMLQFDFWAQNIIAIMLEISYIHTVITMLLEGPQRGQRQGLPLIGKETEKPSN